MSFRAEIELTVGLGLYLVKTLRTIDPWIPIQTVHAYGIICQEVMVKRRIMRGLELAELMQTTTASATRNIQLLCKYGLIEVAHNPLNKVDRIIKLTPKGRELIHKIRTAVKKGVTNER